jgi:hypothetical protein
MRSRRLETPDKGNVTRPIVTINYPDRSGASPAAPEDIAMPKPHPNDDVSRENLTRLLEGLNALSDLMRETATATPLIFTVAKARLRITAMKARVYRMIDAMPDAVPTGDQIPTPAEALARLAAARGCPKPWLSPTILEIPIGVPEVIGPAVYVPEAATPNAEQLRPRPR